MRSDHTNHCAFLFFIDHVGLCELWLSESFIKEELDTDVPQSCYDFVTTDYNELSQRTLEHRAKKQVKATFVCEQCRKTFSRPDSLRRHEKLYCKVKSKQKCCRYCGKVFEKLPYLQEHIKRVHECLIKLEKTQ